jgi:glycosyltransferase involved in cell wall biosynthesis
MKHRVLLHTNSTQIKTGLAENAKTLLKYLYKTGKYDLGHYCSQTSIADPSLRLTPWASFGCLPNDPRTVQELNSDPGKARDATYGAWNIDNVVREFKPSIYIGSDDLWAFPKHAYYDRPWWKQINPILHVTIDSLPIMDQAYEQALATPTYLTWARFAMQEMHRRNPKCAHVGQIYGAMDTAKFAPISDVERTDLRKRFGLAETTTVFLFVGRNQLRKQFVQCIEAFAHFKREHPQADAKLWFHTSFSEKGQGWDIMKLAAYHGVRSEDILSTYVCRQCGQWHVSPYRGEDIDCPYCGAQKSMITANITNGVRDEEMRYLYGVSDACISAFSSGGQEYHNSQSLLCGKPLASTNYSSGADFCEQPFVYTLGFSTYYEHGTNFIKATTSSRDIKNYMVKVWKSSKRELAEWGEKGREWAVKTFSIETIGAQWERMFDGMKPVDWSTVNLTVEPKNDTFPFPEIGDENQFIHTLYREILRMEEREDGAGFLNWKTVLSKGGTRRSVYDYFISEARKENAKNQATKQSDLWDAIDKTTGKKRALFVIKESLGDCLIATQLFESFHTTYPNHDLYVATKPDNFSVFAANPHIYRLLPWNDAFENEMAMTGAGQKDAYFDVFMHPAIPTQRQLNYLSMTNIAYDLTHEPR